MFACMPVYAPCVCVCVYSVCIYIYIYKCVFDSQRWCQVRGGERRGAAPSRTMPLSHWISQAGAQAGRLAGWQAAAHSRGNDTALLLWEGLTEREQGEMRYTGVRAILASAVLWLYVLLYVVSLQVCQGAAFLARPLKKALKMYFLDEPLTLEWWGPSWTCNFCQS